MNKLLITLCSLIALSACSGSDTTSKLSFTLGSKKAYLIDASSTSCNLYMTSTTGGDISAKYFSFLGGSGNYFSWSSTTSEAHIVAIRIKANGGGLSGGSYECKIVGDELGWLFYASTSGMWNGVIPAATSEDNPSTVTMNKFCGLKCGGVSTNNVDFESNLQMEIIGYERDTTSGDETPLKIIYDKASIVNLK